MPSISQTIKFRNLRRFKEQRNPWKKLGLGVGLFLSLLGAILSLAGFWLYSSLTQNLPLPEVLPSLLEPPQGSLLQPTRLYDRTGQHVILTLENPASAGKQYLRVGAALQTGEGLFSQYLTNATIAELDPDFWIHPGYTLAGLSAGAHPTLAQRLVSDLVLDAETPSLRRNMRERLLAAQATSQFGRRKILEWFLTSAQYGDLIYGADAAAHAYFGKSAAALSLAEAAMLTAMAENPAIDPLTGLQMLKLQQEWIIQRMLVQGLINSSEAQQALLDDIQIQSLPILNQVAPAFTQIVFQQLSNLISMDRIRRGGYEIVTSLDYDLQLEASCTSAVQLARLRGLPEQDESADGTPCEAARLLPTLQVEPGNAVKDLNVELAILDPGTGQILAFVVSEPPAMDVVHPAGHPGGAILSPFLYLTAFARGMSPATLLWDLPVDQEADILETGQAGQIQGETSTFHGPVRLRTAFVNDYSAAASSVLQQVGIDNVRQTVKSFGINIPAYDQATILSLADIYSQPISLLETVQAYAVLANQGVMVGQPGLALNSEIDSPGLVVNSILTVSGVDGRLWVDRSIAQSKSIISPQLAYLATQILSDETARWPSLGHPNALEIGRPAAAKVGMTSDGTNAWSIGYLPQLAVGVWAGDLQADMKGDHADISTGLWHAVIQYASTGMSVQDFSVPDGMSTVQVCDPSGLLVTKLCPAIVEEVFLSGSEPTQEDYLYQKYYVNRESGLLATVFTPAGLVDEKVFMTLPNKALTWAKQTNLSVPPDTYDEIRVAQSVSEDVQITGPQILSQVGGQISITGSATGDDFSFYRLQVGQGLYPQKWVQIGQDVAMPVKDGILGTWDTSGEEGLYAVELQAVKQYQRIEQAFLLLVVDNTAPQINLISPVAGERIAFQDGGAIMLQASALDNLEVGRVEFYVDDTLISTLVQPPFVVLWRMQPGEHKWLTRVYDLAGNMSETQLTFIVYK